MRTLFDKVERLTRTPPDRIAIVDGDRETSYGQLARRVNKVAHELLETPQGSTAIIVIENSATYAIALFACWKAGLIAVPIDVGLRSRELRRVLDLVRPAILLHSQRGRRNLNAADLQGLPTLDVEEAIRSVAKVDDRVDRAVDDALIIHTSGTSGNPKGVVLTHDNLLANTRSIIEYLELSHRDSTVCVLPFHYSYGNSVLLTHLAVGGKVIVGKSMMYPQAVTEQLREASVSGFAGVPTTFALLLDRTDFAANPPTLRYVTQAGGAMGVPLTRRLRAALAPETELLVMYGQTEASARLTWLPANRLDEKLGSAGIPIPGVEIRIRGSNGETRAPGQVGEIQARGENIMSRYWQNTAATSAAIVDGWLCTGDMGFLDEDGYLFVEGRRSEMIKTGAYRVSPLEIEEVVCELPFIDDAAACGVTDPVLGAVVGLAVVGEMSPRNAKALLAHCRQALSSYKVPRLVRWRASLPKTASGKIKRHVVASDLEHERYPRPGVVNE